MAFRNLQVVTGAAIIVAALAAVLPGMARPVSPSTADLLSQSNRPVREGVPQLLENEVQGQVTRINGDQVEMRLSSGETRTYTISQAEQQRNRLEVGSEIVLTVRDDSVIAIRPASETTTSDSVTSGAAGSSESSSSSSSTVIRRETTVQQTRPAPAPAAVDDDNDDDTGAAQPVRGLW